MDDNDEPLRKSVSVSSELAMQIKTEQICSKNSRKYMSRRFRPELSEQLDQYEDGAANKEENKL